MFKKKSSRREESASLSGASPADNEEQVVLHQDAHEDGGLACNNEQLLRQQREAIMQWVKSMGKRLLAGSLNLINTPFPVTIFEARSYLEKLADVWVYPRYLSAAAATTDPTERMKFVVAYFVAGLHHAFENWRKPFNPILGETWQAHLSDGTAMFMEQISHHPPVSAFNMEGPGGSYWFRGLSQPTVSIVLKHYGFKTVAKGYRYVEFADGTRIEIHYPVYYIRDVINLKGLITSNKPRAEVEGEAVLVDTKNNIKAVLNFGALKSAKSKVLRRSDAVTGFIYKCSNAQALNQSMGAADKQALHAAQAASAAAASQRSTEAGEASGALPEDEDSDVYESASETEWDPSKEEADGSTADDMLTHAAEEAVAAESVSERMAQLDMAESSSQVDSLLVERTSAPSTSGSGGGKEKTSGSSFFGSKGMFGSLMKLGTSTSSAPGPSAPVPDESVGTVLAAIEGSWLSHLDIGGHRIWSIATERPDHWVPAANPLQSDCRFRQDLVTLASGDLKAAQKAKENLENLQRADKKLREAATGRSGH